MEEKKQELEHLNSVLSKLKEEAASLFESLEMKQKEIVQMKRDYWDSLTEIFEFGYEAKNKRTFIEDNVKTADERLQKHQLYEKMLDSPYFARIDFVYDGEIEAETYYIGIGSFYPTWAFQPLIFDWRAPISSLFYDYDKGEAYFIAPSGKINGRIVKKFQYMIKNGKLEYYFEHDIKIDDDILKRELGLHSDVKLKNIIATIQKEQNKIIRNDSDRILVVQGAAGSGKTSIALHRIAYLLYHKRNELSSKNILILTPNAVFSDYISQILPELGEENILEMSFEDFAEKELSGIIVFESKYDNLEYYFDNSIDIQERMKRRAMHVRKQSKEFVDEMNSYVQKLESRIVDFKDLSYRQYYRSAETLQKLFYKFNNIPLLNRLKAIAEFIIEEEATLNNGELDIIITEVIVQKIIDMYITTDLLTIYQDFLGDEVINTGEDNRRFPYEDVFPILYLKYLLYGTFDFWQIKHVVVDEMQDYSYIQYIILQKLFPCSMTILGDINQVTTDEPSMVLKYLEEVYSENVRTITLNKSYRSTYEIASFAGNIIKLTGVDYFERHGKEPLVIKLPHETVFQKLTADLIEIENSYDSIAIICKTSKEANELYSGLNNKYQGNLPITLLNEESNRFQKGIIIAPFYLVKGLEFDAVIIPHITEKDYQQTLLKQIFYVSCTRALHELYIYEELQ